VVNPMTNRELPYDRTKRVLDLALGSTALVLLSPAIGAIALLVLASLGRPVFLRQDRPGRDRVLFGLVRFRTTRGGELTRLGRWLRVTHLDVLPALWNVLRGEMSVVGPRPLLPACLERHTRYQARRYEVRPGLTGLAQVHRLKAPSWNQRLLYDVQYVKNRSFLLDLLILIRTVAVMLCCWSTVSRSDATASRDFGTPTPRRRPTAAAQHHRRGKTRRSSNRRQRGETSAR